MKVQPGQCPHKQETFNPTDNHRSLLNGTTTGTQQYSKKGFKNIPGFPAGEGKDRQNGAVLGHVRTSGLRTLPEDQL